MINLLKKYWYIPIIILCILYIGYKENESYTYIENKSEIEDIESIEEDLEVVKNYYVDIKGEVVNPGVYEVNEDNRIIDVINLAGGLTKNADTSLLNLSKKIVDEMNIKIYSKKEVEDLKKDVSEKEVIEIIKEVEKECICEVDNDACNNNSIKNDALIEEDNISEIENNSSLININTATKEELMSIPNIGEQKANNIIEYRSKNKFTKIDDVLNVSGIGSSIFEKIKDYITV